MDTFTGGSRDGLRVLDLEIFTAMYFVVGLGVVVEVEEEAGVTIVALAKTAFGRRIVGSSGPILVSF